MTAGRLLFVSLLGLVALVLMKLATVWYPIIFVANYLIAMALLGVVIALLRSRVQSFESLLGFVEMLFARLAASARRDPPPQALPGRAPSVTGWLVNAAVRRLPARMGDEERRRWEEEMRADVAGQRGALRLVYAFGLWRKGAPAMPVGNDETPHPAAGDVPPFASRRPDRRR